MSSAKTKTIRSAMSEGRRERRRTTDREAQRASRARTKKRVEELEIMVESLLANQGDERVNILSRQLEEQRQQNKELMASLAGIQKILNGAASNDNIPPKVEPPQSTGSDSPPTGNADLTESEGESQKGTEQAQDNNIDPILEQSTPKVTEPTTLPDLNLPDGTRTPNICAIASMIDSTADIPEAKRTQLTVQTTQRLAWEIVNTAMLVTMDILSREPQIDTQFDADITVRAVVQGWADVEAAYKLDVGWKMLAQIDQFLFFNCGPVARLAILRVIRLQMLQKVNAFQNGDSVPSYMQVRAAPSLVDHPILVDFFVWPDLRDHMLLSPSLYYPNRFARHFSRNVRFLWPDSINDTWTIAPDTGRYAFTSSFNARFQDMHCWAMSVDFFMQYPEIIGMVPMHNPVPRSLTYPPPEVDDTPQDAVANIDGGLSNFWFGNVADCISI